MGGQLKLVNLTKSLLVLIAIRRLLTVFEFYATELEALDSYEPQALNLENTHWRLS
jgi:hypothetical protein